MYKKIISAIIAILLVGCTVIFSSADTLSDLKNEQAKLEQEAKEYQAILDEKEGELLEQQEYVDALTAKVAVLNNEIRVMREKIDVYDTQIAEKTENINQLNIKSEENLDLLRQRIKAIYIAGDTSTLEIVLGAKDFTDFVDKVQLLESLSEYDANLIDEIESQMDAVNSEIEQLNEARKAIEEENQLLLDKQAELDALLKEHEKLLANLYTDVSEIDELIHSNEASQSELEKEIQAYYEKLKEQQQQQQQQQQQPQTPNVSAPSGGKYVWPVPGYYTLSSPYGEDRGYSHGGIDIAGPGIMGSPVVASASGTVISCYNGCSHNWGKYGSCGCGGGFGNYVWIDHGNGKATIYAHCSYIVAFSGDYVTAGQTIGYVGTTGYSTGPHLHFECRYFGTRYDPMSELV